MDRAKTGYPMRIKTGYPNKYGKMKIVKKTAISFSSCMFSELPKTAKSKAVRMIVNTKSSELNVEIGMGWTMIYPYHFYPYLQLSASRGYEQLSAPPQKQSRWVETMATRA
jgi:hypothetical protein